MTLEVAEVYKHPRLTDLGKRLRASDGGSGHAAKRLRGIGVVDQSMETMLQEFRQFICQIPQSTPIGKKICRSDQNQSCLLVRRALSARICCTHSWPGLLYPICIA